MNIDSAQRSETGLAFFAPSESSEASSGAGMEIAFCCIAQFSSAVSHQSKVTEALAYFRATFGLANVAIYRFNHTENASQIVATVGTPVISSIYHDADQELISLSGLKDGCAHITQTASGATMVQVILNTGQQNTDVIVFEFPRITDSARISALNAMASALAVAWRMRQPGLVGALIHAQTRSRQSVQPVTPEMPILSEDNAYGLSRSEFRVCRLLATGLKPQLIARELGVSITTIRTHLSNIYAKTELPGQLEVVSHISRSALPVLQAA